MRISKFSIRLCRLFDEDKYRRKEKLKGEFKLRRYDNWNSKFPFEIFFSFFSFFLRSYHFISLLKFDFSSSASQKTIVNKLFSLVRIFVTITENLATILNEFLFFIFFFHFFLKVFLILFLRDPSCRFSFLVSFIRESKNVWIRVRIWGLFTVIHHEFQFFNSGPLLEG